MQVQDERRPFTRAPAVNARLALTLLVFINLFNYIDRQVFAAVEKQISEDLFGAAPTESVGARMGLLQTAFLVSYMLLAPVFGFLADRMSRWHLIAIGVILWTVASGASGLPWNSLGVSMAAAYWLLFLTRCFVGVGEAAYGPVAPAMIADLFPVSKRGKVMAWFYLAIPVGGALGYALGGQVKQHMGPANWHWAFYLVVPPGLLLGLWCLFMRDPPRGQSDSGGPVEGTMNRVSVWASLRVLRIPSYMYNTLGMTMMTFAIGGLAFWMPRYFEQHEVQGFAGVDAGTAFGGITALAGLIATLSGGLLGDALRPRFPGSYFLVSGVALILGFPMVLGFLVTPFPYAWGFVFAAVFCLFFNTGPSNTILANVTHPSVRASAFALNILIIHLFGDAVSPFLIGWIGDEFSTTPGQLNLAAGFAVVSALMLVGGLFWLWGARHLERDTRLAPTRL
jgi:MFS transporter, Spinster family, sphingosine-1-phosphate transporter